ncbi:hypothetical protein [Streptomyces sp. DW26H14]|uniref:hypothetical protein n=1 Tax=Streptomyces sp. DW26H14 TaxID=3435395 RepID=UPI00403DC1DC
MPDHKMTVIDGIRYRPEDVARTRRGAGPQVLSLPHAHPRGREGQAAGAPFDPGAYGVPAVLDHLSRCDEDETVRVLDAEAAGRKRKGLLEQREQLLTLARKRGSDGDTS